MHTLSTPLIIFLVLVAAVVLANIITIMVIGGGSKWPHTADPATDQSTNKLSDQELARLGCDCRCHREKMFPGMRCLDCFGDLCDEGTTDAKN